MSMHHVFIAEEEGVLALCSYHLTISLDPENHPGNRRHPRFHPRQLTHLISTTIKLITLKLQVSLSTRKSLISHIKAAT